jgi:formylglycine-generating enzyme required for sulfatase activity
MDRSSSFSTALTWLALVISLVGCKDSESRVATPPLERGQSVTPVSVSRAGSDHSVNRTISTEWIEEKKLFRINFGDRNPVELVQVPAGELLVPLPRKNGTSQEESPTTKTLVIKHDFWISTTEISQGQWLSLMANNPSYFIGDDLPVHGVNWDQAMEFCEKLSESTEKRLTLPTDVQWEFACRAGTTSKWYWGNEPGLMKEHEWYYENSNEGSVPQVNGETDVVRGYEQVVLAYEMIQVDITKNHPHPVGVKKPNPWGLYDTLGNVVEWTRSPCVLQSTVLSDPPEIEGGIYYWLCGGDFLTAHPIRAFPSDRSCEVQEPEYLWPNVGFRIVMEVGSESGD